MGFFSNLFTPAITEPVTVIGNVFDKLFTSDEEKLQAKAVLERLKQQPHILQAEITKLEAQSRIPYVASSRPTVIYCCCLGLLISYVVSPVMQWCGYPPIVLPLDHIEELIYAILGLGFARSVDKAMGKAK